MTRYAVRRAVLDDADRLWRWRCDPDTVAASIHPPPESYERHVAWLLAYRGRIMIVEIDGEPIGTIRIDDEPTDQDCTVSVTVDPTWRGQGHGAMLILCAVQEAQRQGYRRAHAKIKTENRRSQSVFAEAGFVRWATIDGVGLWRRTL